MGRHDAAGGHPADGPGVTAFGRLSRLRTVFVAAASITWLFTVICLIGVVADGDSDARLGFVILGLPFLAAALACTYGARTLRSAGQVGGAVTPATKGEGALVSVATADEVDLDDLPDGTPLMLAAMRRSYAELDAKLAGEERDSEAWQTMTQIVRSIVPTTVRTYRRVAGDHDADAEFVRAVQLLCQTFDERRAAVTSSMLDGLRVETRYIEDRFRPSELTVDNQTDGQHLDSSG